MKNVFVGLLPKLTFFAVLSLAMFAGCSHQKKISSSEETCAKFGCLTSQYKFSDDSPMTGMDFCVKNASGELVFKGRTDKNGEARYVGKTLGEEVTLELCFAATTLIVSPDEPQ